jgi:hypothetical protein
MKKGTKQDLEMLINDLDIYCGFGWVSLFNVRSDSN